jgi:hypothetical protein
VCFSSAASSSSGWIAIHFIIAIIRLNKDDMPEFFPQIDANYAREEECSARSPHNANIRHGASPLMWKHNGPSIKISLRAEPNLTLNNHRQRMNDLCTYKHIYEIRINCYRARDFFPSFQVNESKWNKKKHSIMMGR